jgi:RND family efflux transporter MFP subunit
MIGRPKIMPRSNGIAMMSWCGILVCLVLPLSLAQPANTAENPGESPFECVIVPKLVLKLGTAVPGLVREVLVDRGDMVKKGDVVARLESGAEEAVVALAAARATNDATVQSARAKVEFHRRKLERAQQLRKSESIAVAQAEEAETSASIAESELYESEMNLMLARLEVARARELLAQRTVRSPITGVVVELMLGPGEYAFDQGHLVTVAQIDPLRVEAHVPLSQYGRIDVGSPAWVYPEQPIGGRYEAVVVVVDRVFDAASGTIGIRLELQNGDLAIPAGLKCEVEFARVG